MEKNESVLKNMAVDVTDNELILEEVRSDGMALQYVPYDLMTEEIVIAAVKQNRKALDVLDVELLPEWDILNK